MVVGGVSVDSEFSFEDGDEDLFFVGSWLDEDDSCGSGTGRDGVYCCLEL